MARSGRFSLARTAARFARLGRVALLGLVGAACGTGDGKAPDAPCSTCATTDGGLPPTTGNEDGSTATADSSSDAGGTLDVNSTPDITPRPLACDALGAVGVWESVTPTDGDGGTIKSVNEVVIDPINAGTVYAGTQSQGIYRSKDCGATWTKVNTGRNGATLDTGTQWTMAIDGARRGASSWARGHEALHSPCFSTLRSSPRHDG